MSWTTLKTIFSYRTVLPTTGLHSFIVLISRSCPQLRIHLELKCKLLSHPLSKKSSSFEGVTFFSSWHTSFASLRDRWMGRHCEVGHYRHLLPPHCNATIHDESGISTIYTQYVITVCGLKAHYSVKWRLHSWLCESKSEKGHVINQSYCL